MIGSLLTLINNVPPGALSAILRHLGCLQTFKIRDHVPFRLFDRLGRHNLVGEGQAVYVVLCQHVPVLDTKHLFLRLLCFTLALAFT